MAGNELSSAVAELIARTEQLRIEHNGQMTEVHERDDEIEVLLANLHSLFDQLVETRNQTPTINELSNLRFENEHLMKTNEEFAEKLAINIAALNQIREKLEKLKKNIAEKESKNRKLRAELTDLKNKSNFLSEVLDTSGVATMSIDDDVGSDASSTLYAAAGYFPMTMFDEFDKEIAVDEDIENFSESSRDSDLGFGKFD